MTIAQAEAFIAEVAAYHARGRAERAEMLAQHRRGETAARAADRADIYALQLDAETSGERLPMLLPSGVADSTVRVWATQRAAVTAFNVAFDASHPLPSLPVWLWLQRLTIWRSPGQLASTTLVGVGCLGRGVRYRSWRGNRWVRVDGRWRRDG